MCSIALPYCQWLLSLQGCRIPVIEEIQVGCIFQAEAAPTAVTFCQLDHALSGKRSIGMLNPFKRYREDYFRWMGFDQYTEFFVYLAAHHISPSVRAWHIIAYFYLHAKSPSLLLV